ncbi:MAG: hypothetical protein PHE83_17375 [Opitutaceae bacterium]|nr:hypothetical protein [Opitutaceae bacterium]
MNSQLSLFPPAPVAVNARVRVNATDRTGRNRHQMQGMVGRITSIMPTQIGDLAVIAVDGADRIIRVLTRNLEPA